MKYEDLDSRTQELVKTLCTEMNVDKAKSIDILVHLGALALIAGYEDNPHKLNYQLKRGFERNYKLHTASSILAKSDKQRKIRKARYYRAF